MGSLVVKLDAPTTEKLKRRYHYSDIDMFNPKADNRVPGDVETKNSASDVPMLYDVAAVKASIRNILMWRVGESILFPTFGHKLQKSMYSQMNQFNQDAIAEEVKRAIEENEPRAKIEVVSAKMQEDDDGSESNALRVRVVYTVVGYEDRLVEEATISGK